MSAIMLQRPELSNVNKLSILTFNHKIIEKLASFS